MEYSLSAEAIVKSALGKAAVFVVAAGLLFAGLVQLSAALGSRAMIKPPGEIVHTAVSPDGNILVTLHETGRAQIIERSSQKKIGEIRGHGAAIKHIQFSSDGKYITSVDETARGLRTAVSGMQTRETLHGASLVSAAETHVWRDGLGIVGNQARRAVMFDMPMAAGRRKFEARAPAPVLPAGFAPPAPGRMFRDCEACPELVVVPAGTFVMGSPESEEGRDNERPQRTVTISQHFAVGRFEVTFAQYRQYVAETGVSGTGDCYSDLDNDGSPELSDKSDWRNTGFEQGADHPVVCISWEDAKVYVRWLSEKTGETYRLLTEAEWEYAARAGSTGAYHNNGDEIELCQIANGADLAAKVSFPDWITSDCEDGHVNTSPAGYFRPNAFGLYDMSGNVYEWTEDCWNGSYSGAPDDGSAWLSGDCGRRVMRGGAWNVTPTGLRSAYRFWDTATRRYSRIGFRIARTL